MDQDAFNEELKAKRASEEKSTYSDRLCSVDDSHPAQ